MAITRIGNPAIANIREPNFRNILINGDMSQSQRATSASSLTGSGYNTVDRYRLEISSLGTWTQSQSTDVPTGQGFAKSLKMDCTTADASPGTSDYIFMGQKFEGQNLQYLKKGTSSAQSLTLSFWVKSNKTGTYIVEIRDADNDRNICKSYTISSSDTWEKKELTFAGDTTGSLGNDNGDSLNCTWWLAAGTDFTSGTLATSWEARNNTDRAVGQVNLADSTSNEWYITGVQLEAGTTASEFEFLAVDVNLQRCQRYFERTTAVGASSNYVNFAAGVVQASGNASYCFLWKTKKRANPTMSSTAASTFLNENGGSYPAGSAISFSQINKTSTQCDLSSSSGLTQGNGALMKSNGTYDAYIDASSEL
jgi:hypothetical protein